MRRAKLRNSADVPRRDRLNQVRAPYRPRLHRPKVLSVDAFVRILTPSDGATLAAKGPMLNYEAVTGASKGNHVHVYVDGRKVATLHHLNGNSQKG